MEKLTQLLQSGLEYLRECNVASIIVRLVLAILAGATVGIDRGRKHRPAGVKTHVLVCMGSALVMITNQYMVEFMGSTADVGRMGAQVISGIGFLGAGTIIVTGRNQVTGLTTAAGLWYSACMGLAIGIGFYEGAVFACIFVVVVLKVLTRVEHLLYRKSKVMDLYIEVSDTARISDVIMCIKNCDCRVNNLDVGKIKIKGLPGASIVTSLYLEKPEESENIIAQIGQLKGIRFIEEI